MCWKKLFGNNTTVLPDFTDNTVVSIVCGNYPGTANDLAGPPNDQVDFEKAVNKNWPIYTFRQFKDSQATCERFLSELRAVVSRMKSGDLLLFIMDTCFSESNTRVIAPDNVLQNRVYHNPKYPVHKKIVNKVLSPTEGLNYIAMSACRDHETAADAVFNGRANGAYHFALMQTMKKGITYRQWDELTARELKRLGFAHVCTIEGPDVLLDRQIFEGTVYCFEISSHGSHTYDESGDEPDQQDEGPYLYDGMIVDDQIADILKDLPVLT